MRSYTAGAVALALAACAPVHAADTAPIDGQQPYASADDAAVAALRAVTEARDESAGVIFHDTDGYHFTAPVTGSERGVTFGILVPHGATLTAIYHTHPVEQLRGSTRSDVFSDVDVRTAQSLRLPSYVGVEATRTVIRYTPFVDRTEDSGMHMVSRGTKVGAL